MAQGTRMGDKMRIMIILVVLMLLFTVACDTELGHAGHDHDGDGVQDHDASEHMDEEHDMHDDTPSIDI